MSDKSPASVLEDLRNAVREEINTDTYPDLVEDAFPVQTGVTVTGVDGFIYLISVKRL